MKNQVSKPTCMMCGKIILDQKNQIVTQIDGNQYLFDNNDCETFFKKFKSIYGEFFPP